MAKKMTIVEQYNAIVAKCEDVLSESELNFLRERAELHAKKNATRKPTKAQNENEEIKSNILEMMEPNRAYTVTEIQKAVGLESNQKASALIRQLKESGEVERSEVKGKAYFTKVC
jgi:predicted transcriptional regulator